MAAAKKKTIRKTKKTPVKKSQGIRNTVQNPLFSILAWLVAMALSVMALGRMGIAGTLLYGMAVWLTGTFAWVFWTTLFFWPIVMLVQRNRKKKLPRRWGLAAGFLYLGMLLLVCVKEWGSLEAWMPLQQLLYSSRQVLLGGANAGGLAGAFLYGITKSLFGTVGCWVAGLFLSAAALAIHFFSLQQKGVRLPKPAAGKPVRKPAAKPQPDLFLEADLPVSQEPEKPEKKGKGTRKARKENPENEPVLPEEEGPGLPSVHFDNYQKPSLDLLDGVQKKGRSSRNETHAQAQGKKLIEILREFSVNARLMDTHIGPSVTKFEIKPEMGVRVSKISNLQNDIQMALGATDIRIEAPIPGKSAVGIEVPNLEKTTVQMRDLMESIPRSRQRQTLLFALGKDLQGGNVYGQMDRMPHLLIAGATGSGKSVCVNSIISSFLLRTNPDEVKLILIDPKKVEFTPYQDVPHLMAPVITDADMANKALKVVVEKMDERYDLFGLCGVRNITAYNTYLAQHPEEKLKPMPRIVVVIDELADLMLAGAKEVEQSIQRITQLARAAGIHLIVATQRPSVDVITGVIKANIPSRIAFAVSSAVDSRTILDQAGAERLLGYGDMLYLPNGETSAKRIQGVFIKDEEVNRIAEAVKEQGKPMYDDTFITLKEISSQGGTVSPEDADPLYPDVKSFIVQSGKCSTSLIQRRFSIGYARAARLMDVLEMNGIIGPARGSKAREVLVGNTLEE